MQQLDRRLSGSDRRFCGPFQLVVGSGRPMGLYQFELRQHSKRALPVESSEVLLQQRGISARLERVMQESNL